MVGIYLGSIYKKSRYRWKWKSLVSYKNLYILEKFVYILILNSSSVHTNYDIVNAKVLRSNFSLIKQNNDWC